MAAQGETEPRFEREISGDNPFHSSTSGLPYFAAPFGTGAPMYLRAEVIRQTALSVFAEEGLDLAESVQIRGEGYSFRADGFDATRGIGFAIVDWSSGESDVMQSWRDEPPTTGEPELIGFGDMSALDEPETGEPFVAFVSPYSSEFMVDTGYGPGEFAEDELIERFAQRLREYIRWAEENGAY